MEPVVMHVVYAVEHGGTERFLCRLVNRLAGGGVRHVVCTLRSAGERARELDGRVTVVPLNLPRRAPWGFLKLARAIRASGAGVVHARNPCTWTDALLACRFARNATPVLAFHGTQMATRLPAMQRTRLRAAGAGRALLTSVSHAGADLLAADLGCARDRVHVLANGVDVERFRPPSPDERAAARRRWGIGDGELAIGNVGNLFTPIKGHAVLVNAFARTVQQYPTARLFLAGFGPLRDLVRAQAQIVAVDSRVQLLGAVENPVDLLAALDVYVCPSLAEGMSNALLEALACGVPCVATDVADHRHMFAPLDAPNLLPPAGDADALADALTILLADPARRAALGASGHRLITRAYRFEDAVDRYGEFYETLLFQKRARESEVAACLS